MQKLKSIVIRVVEGINSAGFALIVGSMMYFIIGSIAKLVGGHMLEWTVCGSLHAVFHTAPACVTDRLTGQETLDAFITRLFAKISLSWLMMLAGFVVIGISSLFLKLLGDRYTISNAYNPHKEK